MTKHTSSNIIFDDTWSSLYCYFDQKDKEWYVRIRKNGQYFLGRGASLQAANIAVENHIQLNKPQSDSLSFHSKPKEATYVILDDDIKDIF